MLVPLRREKFQQIIPMVATGPQYLHYWGNFSDCLRRALISFIGVFVFWLLRTFGPAAFKEISLLLLSIFLVYWLWSPVYWASLRNATYRRFPYSGFWRGKVLDVYITEEVLREEQTVNKRGELVIVESTEKKINLEVGDQTGFKVKLQAPLRRIYKNIQPGQVAEMLIISSRDDLSRVDRISDVYLPQENLWIGEYPYLRRDIFSNVSQQLSRRPQEPIRKQRYNNKR
jgi:hypothetical protein